MEGSESAHLLSLMLTQEERDAVPTDSYKKIESFVVKKFDELFTSKALLETGKFNAGNLFISIEYILALKILFQKKT